MKNEIQRLKRENQETDSYNSDSTERPKSKLKSHKVTQKKLSKKIESDSYEYDSERSDSDESFKITRKKKTDPIKKTDLKKNNEISEFNSLQLKMQESILTNTYQSSTKDTKTFLDKVIKLINYLIELDKLSESTAILELYSPNSSLDKVDDKCEIHLKFKAIESLINNGCFKSSEFIDILKKFDQLHFEIKYPAKSFDDIYKKVLKFRNSKQLKKIILICIFISGITETDKKFRNNKDINCVILDSTIKSITGSYIDGSFTGCSSLTQITIPSSVTEIGGSVFNECSSLTQISIPSSVTEIGGKVFEGCKSLKQITIPSSVTEIGRRAFEGCTSLKQITIPSSVTEIGWCTFNLCLSLIEIKIPSSIDLKDLEIPSTTNIITF